MSTEDRFSNLCKELNSLKSHVMSHGIKYEISDQILDPAEKGFDQIRMKLTYIGPQTKPIPTVILRIQDLNVGKESFYPVQRDYKIYGNDTGPYVNVFNLSPTEFKKILTAVKPLLKNSNRENTDSDRVSFSVVSQTAPGNFMGKEYFISTEFGANFYQKLVESLKDSDLDVQKAISAQSLNAFPN